MDRARITELIEILKASSAAEITVSEGDSLIRIRRTGEGAAPELQGWPAATGSGSGLDADAEGLDLVPVCVKLVGTFHVRRQAEAVPLVEPGVWVAKGQVIGAVEALGKWTEVVSPVAGQVVEILVGEDAPVHYGDVVMRLEPREAGGQDEPG